MSALTTALDMLVAFLIERGADPPTWSMKIFEIRHDSTVDDKGRLQIRKDDLHSPEEFEERFEAIATSRISWVNVSCYGVKNGFMLIGIETPRGVSSSTKPASINFAGPSTAVTNNGWSSDSVVAID